MNSNDFVKSKLCLYEENSINFNCAKINKILEIISKDEEIDLDLREYGLSHLQCQFMFDALTEGIPNKLTSIQLKNNDFDFFCCQSLGLFLQKCQTLKELDFEICKVKSIEGASAFAQGIAKSSSMSYFKVKNCGLSDSVGSILIDAFLDNKICEEIDISMNSLSSLSSKSLENVIMNNEVIKKLNLSYNFFNLGKCFVNIIKGFGFNDFITHVNLSWNGLCGVELGRNFVKSLKKSKIESLNLEHNQMSTMELKKLALTLKKSKTIEQVYIGDNEIIDGIDEILVKVFKSKKNALKLISFGKWYKISEEALKLFNEIRIKKPDIKIVYRE